MSDLEQAVYDAWLLESLNLPLGKNKLPNPTARREFFAATGETEHLIENSWGKLIASCQTAPFQTRLINAYFVNTFSLPNPGENKPGIKTTHFLVRKLFELSETTIEREERGVLVSLFYGAPALHRLKGRKFGEAVLRFVLHSAAQAVLGRPYEKGSWLPERYISEPFRLKAEESPFSRMSKWFRENWEAFTGCANALVLVSQEYLKNSVELEKSEHPDKEAGEFVIKIAESYLKTAEPKMWFDEADILMRLY